MAKKKKIYLDEAPIASNSINVPITSVDTRSDTTRKGYHEKPMSSVQSHSYHPALDLYNFIEEKSKTNMPSGTNIGIVNVPLPGKVNGSVKSAIKGAKSAIKGAETIKDISSQIPITSPFYTWEKAMNEQNLAYENAMKGVEEGKRLYNNLINSREYLDRIRSTLRVRDIIEAYDTAKYLRTRRSGVPYDWKEPWSRFKDMTEDEAMAVINKESIEAANKLIEKSRLNSLNSKEAEQYLAEIKKVNELDDIIYQDKIEHLNDKGEIITHPSAAGLYDKNSKRIHIKVSDSDIPGTYIHEHGGHRVHHNSWLRNNLIGYDRNGNSNIKTWIDFDPEMKDYYTSFDEARARTIPILAKMHDKGYKLSYGGFKKYLKDNNIKVGYTELGPYDDKTVRHLINTVYGTGAGVLGYNLYKNNK